MTTHAFLCERRQENKIQWLFLKVLYIPIKRKCSYLERLWLSLSCLSIAGGSVALSNSLWEWREARKTVLESVPALLWAEGGPTGPDQTARTKAAVYHTERHTTFQQLYVKIRGSIEVKVSGLLDEVGEHGEKSRGHKLHTHDWVEPCR